MTRPWRAGKRSKSDPLGSVTLKPNYRRPMSGVEEYDGQEIAFRKTHEKDNFKFEISARVKPLLKYPANRS